MGACMCHKTHKQLRHLASGWPVPSDLQAAASPCIWQESGVAHHFDGAKRAAHEAGALLPLHVRPAEGLGHAADAAVAQVVRALDGEVRLLACVQAAVDPGDVAVACLGQLLGSRQRPASTDRLQSYEIAPVDTGTCKCPGAASHRCNLTPRPHGF